MCKERELKRHLQTAVQSLRKQPNAIHKWDAEEVQRQGVKDENGKGDENIHKLWEQEEVKNALGRPVTRIILDKKNNIILNIGDLITYHSIREAAKAGSLGILLASVYRNRSN